MLDDAKRWDLIHQQSEDDTVHSHYAEEKEKLFQRGSLVVDLGGGGGQDALYFLSYTACKQSRATRRRVSVLLSLGFYCSGDILGDYSSVVGYAGIMVKQR